MDIESYIRNNISLFKSGAASIEQLTEMFSITLCSGAGIERNEEILSAIADILGKCEEGLLSDDDAYQLLRKIYDGDIEEVYTFLSTFTEEPTDLEEIPGDSYGGGSSGGGSANKVKQKQKAVIVDVDTQQTLSAITQYQTITNDVAEIKFEPPADVASYTEKITTAVTTGKDGITEHLSKLRTAIVELLHVTEDTDACIKDMDLKNLTFDNIHQIIYDRSQNSELVEATLGFFVKNGCSVDSTGNIVTLTMEDGTICKYNLSTNMFYTGDNQAFEAHFYVPKNALANQTYSKLNTYTCFVNSDYKKLVPTAGATNAIVLSITKYKSDKKFDKYAETELATKFLNKVANTDLSEGKCQNIISGDSVYGAHSLKIAAKSDTYGKVYCVNNAVIVTGENGRANWKEQFNSLEELKGLNGKEIYLISASGDENFNRGKNSDNWGETVPYEEGFVYTGIKLLSEYCPDAKVHIVYNEAAAGTKQNELIELLRGVANQYPNCTYDADIFGEFGDLKSSTHTSGNNIVVTSAAAAATNLNGYTVVQA